MEAKEKHWNKKAKLGYASMLERVIKDEKKRNGVVADSAGAAACLKALRNVDKLAAGTLGKGKLSDSSVNKVILEATSSLALLSSHMGNITSASAQYSKAIATIHAGVNSLSQAGVGIASMVQQAHKGKEKALRGTLVRRTQLNAAMDACMDRIAALSKDIGVAIAAGDEKQITKLMEKANKMKHEFSLLEQKNGDLMEEMLKYTQQ